jgi:hypothetical protein
MREVLATVGVLLQAGGTLWIALPVWRGHRAVGFATEAAGLVDEKGRWRGFIRWGLAIYMLGYIPIALSIWWPN